tara:strand:+ start:2047 stop:2232 length:186 start_codon:yes stop_codon:yes gene_type:complete
MTLDEYNIEYEDTQADAWDAHNDDRWSDFNGLMGVSSVDFDIYTIHGSSFCTSWDSPMIPA